MDVYSPLKALRHLHVVEAVREGRLAPPVHVQVILSDLCNQACRFCAYRSPGYTSSELFFVEEFGAKGYRPDPAHPERNYNPARMMPYEKAVELLDDFIDMGVKAVQYTGGGEPTVHPKFPEVIAATIERDLPFSVVTNGVNVSKKCLAPFLAEASWVRVSLDAGTPGTYGQVRQVSPSQFQDALDAVSDIRDQRERQGTGCVIGVGFVVSPDNWHEVIEAAQVAKLAGADNFRISAQFSVDDERLFDGIFDRASALCRQAEKLGDGAFQVVNRFGDRLADLRQKRPDYDRCGYQYFTTYIGADLNVYRCCGTAYNPRGLLGSVKDKRFRALWMDLARMDAMDTFSARSCDRCQFNALNRPLDYVIAPMPRTHEEFV